MLFDANYKLLRAHTFWYCRHIVESLPGGIGRQIGDVQISGYLFACVIPALANAASVCRFQRKFR